MTMETRPISSIKVGGRIRKDLGDLDALAESITNNGGLLQPILIKSDGTLIAGERRLAACKVIGREHIEVNVRNDFASAAALLIAERDENTCRKDFTPSEAVALGKKLEKLERPPARERMAEAGRSAAPGRPAERSGESPDLSAKGDTREKVGPAVGMSGRTYEKAKQVVEAAETGDPVAEEAAAEMDATGKVEPAHRKVTGKQLPPPKPVEVKSKRQRQVAEKAKERLGTVIAGLDGYREGLEDFDVRRALALTDSDERKEWVRMLDGSIKALRELRTQIKNGG